MFSWLIDKIAAFTVSFGGSFWHDTIALILPPLPQPIDVLYVPQKEYKSLIIGLTFGTPLIYDPVTDEYRAPTPDEIPKLTRAGIYHRCVPWMEWHWDPLVKSIIDIGVYPQLGWSSTNHPYELRFINNTDLFIYIDATFWIIRFPNQVYCPHIGQMCDIEEAFNWYMKGIVSTYNLAKRISDEIKPEETIKLLRRLLR